MLSFQTDVEHSKHHNFRKFLFHSSLLYAKFNMMVTYLTLSLNLFTVKLTLDIQFSSYTVLDAPRANLSGLIFVIYLSNLLYILFVSIQTRPRDIGDPSSSDSSVYIRASLRRSTHLLGIFSVGAYLLVGLTLYEGGSQFSNSDLVKISLLITVGCYFILIIFNPFQFWAIIRNSPSFIYYAPTYINSFMLFSFSNIDEFSWGTKGNFDVENKRVVSKYIKKHTYIYNIIFLLKPNFVI